MGVERLSIAASSRHVKAGAKSSKTPKQTKKAGTGSAAARQQEAKAQGSPAEKNKTKKETKGGVVASTRPSTRPQASSKQLDEPNRKKSQGLSTGWTVCALD